MLRRRVLGSREEYAAVVRLVVGEIYQVPVLQSVPRRRRVLKVRADDATDAIDGRVGAAVNLRRRIARLLPFEARHARRALVAADLDARGEYRAPCAR